jgi:hypothetical protein
LVKTRCISEKGKLFERIGRKATGLFKWRLGCRSYELTKKPFFSSEESGFFHGWFKNLWWQKMMKYKWEKTIQTSIYHDIEDQHE